MAGRADAKAQGPVPRMEVFCRAVIMFFVFVSNNWCASADAEPHPDQPGDGHALGGGEEGRIGRVAEGEAAFCCQLNFSGFITEVNVFCSLSHALPFLRGYSVYFRGEVSWEKLASFVFMTATLSIVCSFDFGRVSN